MSRLDELIKELCHNGVEYKELGEVCDFQNGFAFKSSLFKENGEVILRITNIYNGVVNEKDLKYFSLDDYKENLENYIISNNDIVIAMSGATTGKVGINNTDKKFYLNQRVGKFVPHITKLNNKYLYHFLLSKSSEILKNSSGSGAQPNLSTENIKKLIIPVPPLEVQNEIVRILDSFTALIAELTAKLTAELTARKKQYSWYRDYLLKFENKVEIVKLGDISEYSKDKIDIKELSPENYIGIENMLQDAKGVIKSSCLLTEGRCTKFFEGDILIGNIRPYLKKIWLSDRIGGANTDVLVIKKSIESIDNKYLFFVLSSEKFFSYVMKSVKAGKMPRGNKEMIMKYQFPLPSLEVQKRIVEVLDNFEKICNDLNIGLPAEIEARQKQYEFYRNFLLTFKIENCTLPKTRHN